MAVRQELCTVRQDLEARIDALRLECEGRGAVASERLREELKAAQHDLEMRISAVCSRVEDDIAEQVVRRGVQSSSASQEDLVSEVLIQVREDLRAEMGEQRACVEERLEEFLQRLVDRQEGTVSAQEPALGRKVVTDVSLRPAACKGAPDLSQILRQNSVLKTGLQGYVLEQKVTRCLRGLEDLGC